MAIAFRAESDTSNTGCCSNTTITITKPTGTVDGDIMVAIINTHQSCCGAPSAISAPAGWTSQDSSAYTTNTRGAVFTKKASGEGANYVFTITKSSLPTTITNTGSISSYSGCDTTTWLDATTTAATQASSTNLTAPTITTVTASAMVLNISIFNGTGTITDAASTTKRVSREAANGSVYQAEELFVATGATGTRVPTIVGAKVSRGVTVALRPATAATFNPGWATGATKIISGGF